MEVKKGKPKPIRPSWAKDAEPAFCRFPWCENELKNLDQQRAGVCGACRLRLIEQSRRVNSRPNERLAMAEERRLYVRTHQSEGRE